MKYRESFFQHFLKRATTALEFDVLGPVSSGESWEVSTKLGLCTSLFEKRQGRVAQPQRLGHAQGMKIEAGTRTVSTKA